MQNWLSSKRHFFLEIWSRLISKENQVICAISNFHNFLWEMQINANTWGQRSEFLSYDIDLRCETHLLDRNFSNFKFLLPPEIYTVEISGKVISLKNLDFPWKSCDFGVLLVEISGMLPVEMSTKIFSSIRAFAGKNIVIGQKLMILS